MQRSLTIASLFLSAACYGSAPPHPAPVPLPDLSDEAVMRVHSQTTTKVESVDREAQSCPAGASPGTAACTVTHYQVAEPVTRTKSTVTYGAEPISYGQLLVLTDPAYDAKVARLDRLRARCKGANTPRWVGSGLLIGGLVAVGVGGGTGSRAVGLLGWGAVAGGLGSYAFGYYGYGGRTCGEAARLYDELDMQQRSQMMEVWGELTAEELKALADQFNSRREAIVDRGR